MIKLLTKPTSTYPHLPKVLSTKVLLSVTPLIGNLKYQIKSSKNLSGSVERYKDFNFLTSLGWPEKESLEPWGNIFLECSL